MAPHGYTPVPEKSWGVSPSFIASSRGTQHLEAAGSQRSLTDVPAAPPDAPVSAGCPPSPAPKSHLGKKGKFNLITGCRLPSASNTRFA